MERRLKGFHILLVVLSTLACIQPVGAAGDDRLLVYLPMLAGGKAPQIVFESGRDGNSEIYTMEGNGSQQINLTNHPADDQNPVWSPEGHRIVFESYRDGSLQIYVMNANGVGQTQLTGGNAANMAPSWSPDGGWLAYVSMRDGNAEIYQMSASGESQQNLSLHEGSDNQPDWSQNGMGIVFVSNRDSPRGRIANEIYVVNPWGSDLRRLTSDGKVHSSPVWSPGSQRIAYVWDGNLMVMNMDGSGQTRLTPEGVGGTQPSWSPDGKRIAFVYRKDGLVGVGVVNVDGSDLRLFEATPMEDHGWEISRQGAWSPDGLAVVYTRMDAPICSILLGCRINRITADGINRRVLTSHGSESRASWQPYQGH